MQQHSADAPPRLWAVLSFLLGFLACFVLVAGFLALAQKPLLETAVSVLKEWQTILAGLLAVLAAKLTVDAIAEQIAQADRHEEDNRRRRHRAARAELPPALSSLTEYGDQCLEAIKRIPFQSDEPVRWPADWAALKIPPVPPEALATLRRCIETSDDAVYDAMATLLQKLQIQQSRLKSLVRDTNEPSYSIVKPSQLGAAAVDIIAALGRMDSMWQYARRESETVTKILSTDRLVSRAFFANFLEQDYPGLHEALDYAARESNE